MDVVDDFKNDLTVEWPVNNRLSPMRVIQFCLNSGSGTVKYIYQGRAFFHTANWKPNDR